MLDEQGVGHHFFRHSYADLVASLSRKVGIQHLSLVEDAVQASLIKAWELWQYEQPKHPKAWLYRVAYHALLDEFRRRQRFESLDGDDSALADFSDTSGVLADTFSSHPSSHPFSLATTADAVEEDDLLHLIFVCCDASVPEPSRLVIALKVLCGFSVAEIAQRLFMSQANVHKRYQRAKKQLAVNADYFNDLSALEAQSRLPSVLKVLYALFSEGYLSSGQETAIRKDLCEDAMRLAAVLANKLIADNSAIYALQALMAFNYARLDSRQEGDSKSGGGALVLLEEQERSQWNAYSIAQGMGFLSRSASGSQLTRYHLEAAIAAEHCRAKRYEQTNWAAICDYYAQLDSRFPSYLYRLNRVVSLAEWQGPDVALALLNENEPPTWMKASYLWLSVAADLHARCQHREQALGYYRMAEACAPSEAIKQLIQSRKAKYFPS